MTLAFGEFVEAFNDGSITKDATWRAYNIEDMATAAHAGKALRYLGFKSDLSRLTTIYSLGTAHRAGLILSLWWIWRSIAMGIRKTRLKLREFE